jgi:hypothetical protein
MAEFWLCLFAGTLLISGVKLVSGDYYALIILRP